jgi:hypothetical protein
MKAMLQPLRSACCLVFVAASVGCTTTIKSPSKPFTGYAPVEKVPLNVGLQLTEDFRKTEIVRPHLGSKFVIPIGQNLHMNAETMSQRLFNEVQVGSTLADFNAGRARAILTPKVAYASYVNMAGLVSIKLEWTLTDRQGNPLWAGTSSGEGKMKSPFMYDPADTVKEALENLFNNSYVLLSTAREIRQFASPK